MKTYRLFLALLVFCFHPVNAATVSDNILFAFIEANLPELFPGTPQTGVVQGYNFRYYAATDVYVALDLNGEIFMYGPQTSYTVQSLGLVDMYAQEILGWESSHGAFGLFTLNASCVVNKPCNERLVAYVRGGVPPYHFTQDTFANGTRPLNTNIDLGTGNIVGTPSQTGVSTFNICVVDLVAKQNCQSVVVTVNRNTEITANPGAVVMKANYCYPSTCTVSQTILITSTTPWTSTVPGFGSLGSGFTVSPVSGPAGSTAVTISYSASIPQYANGFIRFRTTIIGVYAEVDVIVNTN